MCFVVVQRIAVACSCVLFWFLSQGWLREGIFRIVALVLLAVLACFEKVSSIMNLICVEKDWVVVIAGDDEQSLRGD